MSNQTVEMLLKRVKQLEDIEAKYSYLMGMVDCFAQTNTKDHSITVTYTHSRLLENRWSDVIKRMANWEKRNRESNRKGVVYHRNINGFADTSRVKGNE